MFKKVLARQILEFLERYGQIRPDYDPNFEDEEDKFTGPDSAMLLVAARQLEQDQAPSFHVHSTWESGCYAPYSSQQGRELHDRLMKKIQAIKA